ncbi:MAG TPA: hypothetical protein VFG53_12350 [Anaeromyxobacter sp.]|nr:hypothetical protein [Anaeromyxobacter sp.]
MTVAEIWDRFFWSLLLFLFLTFVWLGIVDRAIAYSPTGFLVALLAAAAYFGIWVKRERRPRSPGDASPNRH